MEKSFSSKKFFAWFLTQLCCILWAGIVAVVFVGVVYAILSFLRMENVKTVSCLIFVLVFVFAAKVNYFDIKSEIYKVLAVR